MSTAALDHREGHGAIMTLARGIGAALAGLFVAAAFALAAMAAALVGLLIAFAALALRFRPRRDASAPALLEGVKTAQGWVIEARAR